MPPPAEGILSTQKYSFYLLFTLKFPGMSKDTSKLLIYLWEFISWISVFLPLHMAFCFLKTVYDRFEIDSIGVLSNTAIQGAWLVCSFIVMLNFKLKSKDLECMMDLIENTFQWRSARGKTYVDMERLYSYSRIISVGWQICPASSVVISLLRPLFKRPLDLPVAIWYPVDKNNPYEFALAYFLQAWAQIIVVCSFAVGSAFFFSFGLLCAGQFNILRCALKNLIFTSGVYKRFPETLCLFNEYDPAEYLYAKEMKDTLSEEHLDVEDIDCTNSSAPHSNKPTQHQHNIPNLGPEDIESFRAALINCVDHHNNLIKVCTMMESFLNLFALLRIVELTLQISFMGFVYVKSLDFIVLMFEIFTALDLFLMTYPANYIHDQNNAVGESLMMSPWYLVSKHFRTDFLIIMIYSQKSLYFTAGKMFILDADRLRKALVTAFSYYTLLSSFDDD